MSFKNNKKVKRIGRFLVQAGVVCGALLLWEILIKNSDHNLIPAPSTALAALNELISKGILVDDLTESIRRVLAGFGCAAACGITLGLLLGASARLHLALSPLIELLRPIPPIAWIPLSMTIFGLGDASACFVIFIGAFYPVLTNTILGVQEVPQQLMDAAQSLGCSGLQRFQKVIWPSSLPSIFAGLRVGLGFAWMCVVAAEMIAARSGLGYEIQLNRQLLRLDRVVAGMVVIGIVGFAMNFALAKLETILLPWRKRSLRCDTEGTEDIDGPRVAKPILKSDRSAISEPLSSAHKTATLDSAATNESTSLDFATSGTSEIFGASIKLTDLSFSYASDNRPVLNKINLEIQAGEIVCFLGPSGCGKTTLLRLLAGLQHPSSGKISINDQPLEKHRHEITMDFQDSALFPWRTAAGNVRFALESQRLNPKGIDQSASDYLRVVGLHKKARQYPKQLSGGQQQRVALARALAYQPKVLLLDEPFASLDSQTKENLQEELSALLVTRGITGVFVTHDIREAIFLGDRVAVFSKNGGQILSLHKIEKKQPRDDSFRYTSGFSESRLLLWNTLKAASDEELPI